MGYMNCGSWHGYCSYFTVQLSITGVPSGDRRAVAKSKTRGGGERNLRRLIWLAGFLALALTVPSGPAFADIFDLKNWNISELNESGDFVRVITGTDAEGHTTLTVQWMAGANNILNPAPDGGIQMFGCDIPGSSACTVSGVSGNNVSWSFGFDGGEYDGFGSFDSMRNQGPGENGGITDALVFTVSGALADYISASQFVAMVRYGNDCSGFVSGRTTTSIKSDAGCARVPEPSSLVLLGSGLIGLAVLGRRWRWMKKT